MDGPRLPELEDARQKGPRMNPRALACAPAALLCTIAGSAAGAALHVSDCPLMRSAARRVR